MLKNLREILKTANEKHFAVPAFNVSEYAMFNALMESSEKLEAPIIIAIHPDELKHIGASMVQGILEKAKQARIPVCVHLDHGSSLDQIIKAIRYGFTSVMIDGSGLPFEENAKLCRKVSDMAHVVDISVEGELGTIGTADNYGEAGAAEIRYTDPDDAEKFIDMSGVDALAIAIGTCHGIYPKGVDPKLRIDILQDIKEKLPDIPLVLHGGSSNPDSEIRDAVVNGVSKINISSDIKVAYYDKMREALKDPLLREPFVINGPCMKALQEVAEHKIKLFRADHTCGYYE